MASCKIQESKKKARRSSDPNSVYIIEKTLDNEKLP